MRYFFSLLGLVLMSNVWLSPVVAVDKVQRFIHFSSAGVAAYGLLEGEKIHVLRGGLFDKPVKSGVTLDMKSVKLLPAVKPSKIIAVGLNYASHFGSTKGANPKLFSKLPSALTGFDEPVWMFPDSTNLHFEGELVVVIGKEAHRVSPEQAPDYMFGVTVGNDVTDRSWQASDLQWMRGKGADSFAPIAAVVSRGLNINDLLIETRMNGEVVQSESTKNLLFNPAEIVSYASQHATLLPGDIIFTGTPGRTRSMKEGDEIEVTINGIGSIRNRVTKKK